MLSWSRCVPGKLFWNLCTRQHRWFKTIPVDALKQKSLRHSGNYCWDISSKIVRSIKDGKKYILLLSLWMVVSSS